MKSLVICICVLLGLASPQPGWAEKKGGGGKGARAAGGGGGGGRGARGGGGGGRAGPVQVGGSGVGRTGPSHTGGGGQHVRSNFQGGKQGSHTGDGGLNASHQSNGQHGLNSRNRVAGHGLNAKTGTGLGGQHNGNAFNKGGNNALNNRGGNALNKGGGNALNNRGGNALNNRGGNALNNHGGNALTNRGGNNRFAANRNGNWRGVSHWRNSHQVFAGYHRVWHDHVWWTGHYHSVVFVGGGYWGHWYWDDGYWFPAWGYVPNFSYGCDCPIYAYRNLPPDQVVVNVQEALQDQGYYRGDVDGQMGELTRDALAQYQKEHDLEVTRSIDEPTVQALGLADEQT